MTFYLFNERNNIAYKLIKQKSNLELRIEMFLFIW